VVCWTKSRTRVITEAEFYSRARRELTTSVRACACGVCARVWSVRACVELVECVRACVCGVCVRVCTCVVCACVRVREWNVRAGL